MCLKRNAWIVRHARSMTVLLMLNALPRRLIRPHLSLFRSLYHDQIEKVTEIRLLGGDGGNTSRRIFIDFPRLAYSLKLLTAGSSLPTG